MENVLSINNSVTGSVDAATMTANTVTNAESDFTIAGGTSVSNCSTTPYYGGFITGSTSYTVNLTVKPAVNGYVVEYAYATYIAKTEKDLNKLIVQLLNPNKGKKNGKKA